MQNIFEESNAMMISVQHSEVTVFGKLCDESSEVVCTY